MEVKRVCEYDGLCKNYACSQHSQPGVPEWEFVRPIKPRFSIEALEFRCANNTIIIQVSQVDSV